MYIGDVNVFRKMTQAETLTTFMTFPVEETITAITNFQDTFNVYVKIGTPLLPRDGKQYITSIGATAPTYVTMWNKLPIL